MPDIISICLYQEFVRRAHDERSVVSLRDVARCVKVKLVTIILLATLLEAHQWQLMHDSYGHDYCRPPSYHYHNYYFYYSHHHHDDDDDGRRFTSGSVSICQSRAPKQVNPSARLCECVTFCIGKRIFARRGWLDVARLL